MVTATDNALNLSDVCRIVRVSPSTLRREWENGTFPKPHKIGRCSRWWTSEINAWIESCKGQTGADRHDR